MSSFKSDHDSDVDLIILFVLRYTISPRLRARFFERLNGGYLT